MEEIGIKALLSEGDKLEIEGKTYLFKRLGLKETMKTVSLLQQAVALGYHDMAFLSNLVETLASQNKNKIIGVATILCGLVDMHDKLFDLIASVMIAQDEDNRQLTLEDLYNPVLFPPYSLLELVVALFKHQDLASFFKHLLVMVDSLVPQVEHVTEKLKENSKN